jgi:hypothetical protein
VDICPKLADEKFSENSRNVSNQTTRMENGWDGYLKLG